MTLQSIQCTPYIYIYIYIYILRIAQTVSLAFPPTHKQKHCSSNCSCSNSSNTSWMEGWRPWSWDICGYIQECLGIYRIQNNINVHHGSAIFSHKELEHVAAIVVGPQAASIYRACRLDAFGSAKHKVCLQ